MSIISNWILRIIIFIIIATIIDALLPETKMKQYVYLVFGFILFLIFTQPLLYLFSIDVFKEVNKAESFIEQSNRETFNQPISYDFQKNEIEAEQRAYILKQAKSKLMEEANSVLDNLYDVKITDLQFEFNNEFDNDSIQQFNVTISPIEKSDHNSQIEPVIISTKKQHEDNLTVNTKAIQGELSKLWGIQYEHINVVWGGGE